MNSGSAGSLSSNSKRADAERERVGEQHGRDDVQRRDQRPQQHGDDREDEQRARVARSSFASRAECGARVDRLRRRAADERSAPCSRATARRRGISRAASSVNGSTSRTTSTCVSFWASRGEPDRVAADDARYRPKRRQQRCRPLRVDDHLRRARLGRAGTSSRRSSSPWTDSGGSRNCSVKSRSPGVAQVAERASEQDQRASPRSVRAGAPVPAPNSRPDRAPGARTAGRRTASTAGSNVRHAATVTAVPIASTGPIQRVAL